LSNRERVTQSSAPTERRPHPTALLEAQFNAGFRAANDGAAAAMETCNALFAANLAVWDAARRAFGDILISWHRQLLGSTDW
jgi:hypothetical protein